MSAERDVGWQIGADVITARQEGRHHDGGPAGRPGRGQYLAGGRPHHVHERHLDPPADERTHLRRKAFDHRHTARPAGAVRHQD
ncbi:hypothetical protein MOKP125_38110 [Mycobacterium avium subsp. hominissuis]